MLVVNEHQLTFHMPNQRPTPEKVYKFIERQHAEDLVQYGNIKVGTLLDFQKTEKYGAEIGDDQEGRNVTRVLADSNGDARISSMRLGNVIFKDGSMAGVPDHMPAAYYEQTSDQYYILSLSLDNERSAMEKMKYDTCVEIIEPWLFAHALNRQLAAMGKIAHSKINYDYFMMENCVYMNKNVVIDGSSGQAIDVPPSTVPIFLQKRLDHIYQKEIRMVWKPSVPDPQPVIFDCPELSAFCKIVEPR